MNILGCLDKPTSGTYRVAGTDVARLNGDELARLRREHFGFIFQRYHLLSHLTAAQNVEVPAVYAGAERKARLAGPMSCWFGWGWATGLNISLRSSPAASSSG
jgi:macrolide transport system ATP-binding/permease protein